MEYNFFDKQELLQLVKPISEQMYNNIQNDYYVNYLDIILNLIDLLLGQINKAKFNLNTVDMSDVYIVGTKLLFVLRRFLAQESIEMLTLIFDGQNLNEYEIPMDELLKHLQIDLEHKTVNFSKELNDYDNMIKVTDFSIGTMMKKIYDWTYVDIRGRVPIGYEENSKGQQIASIYNNNKQDFNVLLRVHGGRKQNKTYYDTYYDLRGIIRNTIFSTNNLLKVKGNKSYKYFNNGWLYEWARSYGLEQLKADSVRYPSTPLVLLMQQSKKDIVGVLKAPDIILGEKQYQLKNENSNKLISFATIGRSLIGIKNAIFSFKVKDPNYLNKFLNVYADNSGKILNTEIGNKIEEQLEVLDKLKIK